MKRMIPRHGMVWLTAGIHLLFLLPDASYAQQPDRPAGGERPIESTAHENHQLQLAFRMRNWQAKHMESRQAAEKHAGILRKLGCEVKLAEHNGHLDVQVRTGLWRSMVVDTTEQVRRWQQWLDGQGFETLHGYPRNVRANYVSTDRPSAADSNGQREVVEYRASQWQSLHTRNSQQAGQLKLLFGALGCETRTENHGNHQDIKLRCAEWMEVELPTHQAAHHWMDFLDRAGFETSHEH